MTAQIRDHQADPPDERAPNSRQRVSHTYPEVKAVRIEMACVGACVLTFVDMQEGRAEEVPERAGCAVCPRRA